MKSPHVVLLFLALTLTISSFAQGRPGSGSGKTPAPTVRSMPSTSQPQLNTPNLGRFFLSGKVVLEDGTPLTESATDRKSTRLNSSHSQISYAVFCLKKKKKK